MPRTTREIALRKFDSINKNSDWIIQHLMWLYETYNKAHPEIGEQIMLLSELAINFQKLSNNIASTI